MAAKETIQSGAPNTCPDCGTKPVPCVMFSAFGFYVGTRCNCGPNSYSRVSEYMTAGEAQKALDSGVFGRSEERFVTVYRSQMAYEGYDGLDLSGKRVVTAARAFMPRNPAMTRDLHFSRLSMDRFYESYRRELDRSRERNVLAWDWLLGQERVTVLCSCGTDAMACHVVLFRRYLLETFPAKVRLNGSFDPRRGGRFEFSNFQPCPFEVDGMRYPSVEHFYQAMKTMVPEERRRIAEAPSAGTAKRMGCDVTLRPDWESVKLDVMREGLRSKFSPFGCDRYRLVECDPRDLIEWNTWHDTFWGRCVCRRHQGAGRNHLGRLLAELRVELVEDRRASTSVQ